MQVPKLYDVLKTDTFQACSGRVVTVFVWYHLKIVYCADRAFPEKIKLFKSSHEWLQINVIVPVLIEAALCGH